MAELKNNNIYVEFNDQTGNWEKLSFDGTGNNSIIMKRTPAFELIVEGKPFFGRGARKVTEIKYSQNPQTLSFVYQKSGVRIIHEIQLDKKESILKQTVQIECVDGGLRKLTAVHYYVPGLAVGEVNDCLVQAPGQVILPDTLYTELAAKPLAPTDSEPVPWYPQGWLEQAPDQTSGLIAVENRSMGLIASAWQYSEIATTFPTIDGDGEFINVAHRHQLAVWLKPGVKVSSEGHCIMLTQGNFEQHLEEFRKHAYGGNLQSVPDIPQWLKDARLLQIDPRPVALWQERLEQYKEMGFNVIYTLPVWSNPGCPYCILDHYEIDNGKDREEDMEKYPEGFSRHWLNNPFPVGTEEELKKFVKKAHDLGFKVLFDFIPQGISVLSSFYEKHPEWMVRDELDRPFASHGWGPGPGAPMDEGVYRYTYSMDWGNPEYRKFMIDWAIWNVKTFDVDGFRTDAMHWKEPNFRLDNPYPAWQTMFGGVRMSEELHEALRKVKPDAVLVSEVWGPIFQRSHEATYENGWLLTHLNKGWLSGKTVMTGAQWARHLADAKDARPEGVLRANFNSNHDNIGTAKLAKESALADAVSFMHTFTEGFPFIWYEELEGREESFREMLYHRSRLSGYQCSYRRVRTEKEELFTALWTKDGESAYLVVVNLSMKEIKADLSVEGVMIEGAQVVFGIAKVMVSFRSSVGVDIPCAGYALIRL